MTVVIVVPGQAEPWRVANSAFRMLVEEVRALQPTREELQPILRGETFQTIDLTVMGSSERRRTADLLANSARRLRGKLLSEGPRDEWERELVQALGVLEMWMEGTLDAE